MSLRSDPWGVADRDSYRPGVRSGSRQSDLRIGRFPTRGGPGLVNRGVTGSLSVALAPLRVVPPGESASGGG